MYVADINTLINLPNPIVAGDYIVGGYYAPGDGGGGTFIWVPTTSPVPPPDEDFGIIFFNLNDNMGYFKRLYSGPINVRWFGAVLSEPGFSGFKDGHDLRRVGIYSTTSFPRTTFSSFVML